jgi:hypothetical protein
VVVHLSRKNPKWKGWVTTFRISSIEINKLKLSNKTKNI